LEENAGALDVTLDAQDLARIDEIAPRNVAFGERYEDMRAVDTRTPPQ
jgi:hypothetical protein